VFQGCPAVAGGGPAGPPARRTAAHRRPADAPLGPRRHPAPGGDSLRLPLRCARDVQGRPHGVGQDLPHDPPRVEVPHGRPGGGVRLQRPPPWLQVCCGNGACDAGEDSTRCPEDCGLSVGAGGPYEGSGGQPTSFTPAVGGNDAVARSVWDFGEGGSSTLWRPTHVYAAPGSYVAAVTASTARAGGTATA